MRLCFSVTVFWGHVLFVSVFRGFHCCHLVEKKGGFGVFCECLNCKRLKK